MKWDVVGIQDHWHKTQVSNLGPAREIGVRKFQSFQKLSSKLTGRSWGTVFFETKALPPVRLDKVPDRQKVEKGDSTRSGSLGRGPFGRSWGGDHPHPGREILAGGGNRSCENIKRGERLCLTKENIGYHEHAA